MDEFDAITSNPIFDREFYAFLRSAANNSAIAYVTSSMNELQRLCYSSEIADSPFFNIFSNLHLKPFEREEALELITKPSATAGIPLEAFAEEILDLSGLFPFYIQIACSCYYDWLEENPGADPDRAEIKERFLEEAGPHFEYFWEQCSPECRSLLQTVMKGEQPGLEDSDICRQLAKNGYLIPQGPRFRIFSRAFAECIRGLDSLGRLRSKPRQQERERNNRLGTGAAEPCEPVPGCAQTGGRRHGSSLSGQGHFTEPHRGSQGNQAGTDGHGGGAQEIPPGGAAGGSSEPSGHHYRL